jgi:periplasmic protein TonB
VKDPSPTIQWLIITKALIFSLVIHGAVLAVALTCSTGKLVKDQEVITIFLAGDSQHGGTVAHGKAGDTDIRNRLRHSQRGERFDESKRVIGRVSAESLARSPTESLSMHKQPLEKVVSVAKPYNPAHEAGAAARSLIVPPSAGESPSGVDGNGDGRAGGGTSGDLGGTGDGTARGAGSRPVTEMGFGKRTDEGQSGYMKEQFVYIRDLIVKKLTYPPLARERGWEGVVLLCFVVRENGTVEQIRVMKSSGHQVLDEYAIRTVRLVQPLPRPPVNVQLIIPIVFGLK